MSDLHLYNSFSRQKEKFEPITPGHVGLYVCGPTVSGESHLGHARPYITFDVVNRYLQYLGYKVRYVRNITDAGHFEEEGREAEDKVAKKALLEMLEPMELVHKYTSLFHWGMRKFNNLEPSIEPTATGHIIEQINMIEDIIAKGYAYESNGSVYFDVKKYAAEYPYGKLSGRVLDDLLETTRELEGQEEKRDKADFALWKKAPAEHIMRWKSPWGEGFPGWHIECSAMSSKYLGQRFDIHGGGMDLQFPHHESEIAQSTIAHGCAPVNYWMHNNMITIDGRKMGKSYNNVVKLTELFSGDHPILEQAYHPMVIRFYILQTHYRSTLDFSNEALQASEKALKRLWEAYENLKQITISDEQPSLKEVLMKILDGDEKEVEKISWNSEELIRDLLKIDWNTTLLFSSYPQFQKLKSEIDGTGIIFSGVSLKNRLFINLKLMNDCFKCKEYMDDDFNTAKVLANLFENLTSPINSIKAKLESADFYFKEVLEFIKYTFKTYLEDILGLQALQQNDDSKLDSVLQLVIEMRKEARARKDYAASDKIRDMLAASGISLKDEKGGEMSYTIE